MALTHDILLITSLVISLGAGSAAILMAHSLERKYRLPALSTWFYLEILRVIFGFYGLAAPLLASRMLPELFPDGDVVSFLALLLPMLGLPFLIALWYLFIRLCRQLAGHEVPGLFTLLFFSSFALLLLAGSLTAIYMYQGLDGYDPALRRMLKPGGIILSVIVLVAGMMVLWIRPRYPEGSKSRQMTTLLPLLFAVPHVIYFILSLTLPGRFRTDPLLLVLYFAADLPALIWYFKYLERQHVPAGASGQPVETLESFFERYDLSPREQEIVAGICNGMTNQQIADKLFISIHTVKSHSHSIYEKTGVNNRVQLVNLIRNRTSKA
ncbi:MAG: helix-turn-helix transcriptional regulator [Bacteroidales bacterium]|nr:helix-turn-helix transcriptional regulator [Bacteroidales bacterium]